MPMKVAYWLLGLILSTRNSPLGVMALPRVRRSTAPLMPMAKWGISWITCRPRTTERRRYFTLICSHTRPSSTGTRLIPVSTSSRKCWPGELVTVLDGGSAVSISEALAGPAASSRAREVRAQRLSVRESMDGGMVTSRQVAGNGGGIYHAPAPAGRPSRQFQSTIPFDGQEMLHGPLRLL